MNNWKKRFAVIWAGQLFSILSSNAAQFAIVLWISLKTGSAEALSFAAIAALLPQMTLKVFSGTPYQVSLIEILFGVGTLAGGLLPPSRFPGYFYRSDNPDKSVPRNRRKSIRPDYLCKN